ncbi:hypothetical protein JKA74_15770 [Marivirga sp. S37H4]|uniref:Uncharacterized protein n=1 Tax=Marivirga aurantiaca TaxID=2802615 RepID=A0A935CD22_9BACT|nr:hypothetical protein [Marivirga aurantiaca]MBK6266503.1 hypothetical protein [Marivirga aurantiaca]
MSISIETVRVGKKYYLKNHREYHEFVVLKAIGQNDFVCKDLNSLERFSLNELTAYGKGSDYEFFELES